MSRYKRLRKNRKPVRRGSCIFQLRDWVIKSLLLYKELEHMRDEKGNNITAEYGTCRCEIYMKILIF